MPAPGLTASRAHLWRILLPLCIGVVLSLAGDLTLYAVLPAYAGQRAFSLVVVGMLLSANRLVRLGSNPLVGLLLVGARRRGFVLAGYGLGAISTLLYVLANGAGLFLAGRLLWGISWSLINIGSYCMLLDAAAEQDRGWGSGVLQSAIFTGMALNPLLGGVLSDWLGFSSALGVCAAIQAAGFLIALLTLPETLPAPAGQLAMVTQSTRAALSHWQTRLPEWLAQLRTLLPNLRSTRHNTRSSTARQNAVANYIYFAANFIGDGILLSTLSMYLKTHFGDAISLSGPAGWVIPVASASGALLALRAVIAALAAPLAGRLSDTAAANRAAAGAGSLWHRWQAMAWGIFLGMAGLLVIVGLRSPASLLAGVALAASGSAVVVTVAPPLVREINPAQEASAFMGLLATSADLGTALAPLATYALLDRLPLEIIYSLAALALGLGLPLIGLVHKQAAPASAPPNPTPR